MLGIISVLLMLGIFLIIYYQTPLFLNRADQWQQERSERMSLQLEDAFIFVHGKRLRIFYFVTPCVLGGLGLFLFKLPGAAAGAVLGVILPATFVKVLIGKRKSKFSNQIIDTLMIISSCLKGGLSLVQSLENVMEEMPPPMADECGLVVRETKVGVSLEESLLKLNNRMRSEDLDLIISSILVARETGGDLTKVFSRLINTIRDRMEIKDMAATLTLQGRVQGIIMSVIPVVFIIVIVKFNPNHFEPMLKDEVGKTMLMAAVIMQILAFFFIKKFSSVKV